MDSGTMNLGGPEAERDMAIRPIQLTLITATYLGRVVSMRAAAGHMSDMAIRSYLDGLTVRPSDEAVVHFRHQTLYSDFTDDVQPAVAFEYNGPDGWTAIEPHVQWPRGPHGHPYTDNGD